MMTITYLVGDATRHVGPGNKIIAHVCNDVGGWGAGFALAISARWKGPEREYLRWFKFGRGFGLGETQFVEVRPGLVVANMIGQRGVGRSESGPPIRYDAVAECLRKVAAKALGSGASVHMPRIGCGLAGGEWSKVEPLVVEALCLRGVPVTVYDFVARRTAGEGVS